MVVGDYLVHVSLQNATGFVVLVVAEEVFTCAEKHYAFAAQKNEFSKVSRKG